MVLAVLGLPQQWQLPATLFLGIVLSILFLARRCRSTSRKDRLHLPPSPPGLPILGNLHQMGTLPHRSLWKMAQQHGPVMLLRLGKVPTVVVSSAEGAREVMKTHDADCCSRPDTPGPRRISYGHKDVSFSPYSEQWRERRKILVVEFLSMRRVQNAWYAREAQVDKLIDRLTSNGQQPVFLEDHIFRYMDGIVGTVAFGNIYGTEQFGQTKHFHDVINEAMIARSSFCAEDFFPNALGRLVDHLTGVVSRREHVFREFDAFFETIIEQHLQSTHTTPRNDEDLVDVLIGLTKEHQGSIRFGRDHIKALLTNTFIGSIDTCSVTIVWAMSELIRKPSVLKKVQDEIRTMIGNKERVQPNDLSKLKYLKTVVMETLRLHPALPLLVPRETMRQINISGSTIWDNSKEFDPDRFEGKDVSFNGTHFDFVPFGAGRRMCPGITMGVTATEFTLANLLHCFDWKLPKGVSIEDINMEEAGGLTVHKKTSLVLVPTRYNWQRRCS
ncbi:unnamed protein product [Urochloa decumbens]|uniref:4-hydroxyphenylacetaldehyde oxime monooxygenase n=1 Tax=Urochloa decumbens TaxID=240449 RepID=A0ABC8XY76_9POAL